jgi:hypothetical protein
MWIVGIVVILVILAVVYAMFRAAWRLRAGDVEEAGSDGNTFRRSTDVGKTHRPSGALGHGSTVPPGYVPPVDEGRPPH